jgi:hypothetical protein
MSCLITLGFPWQRGFIAALETCTVAYTELRVWAQRTPKQRWTPSEISMIVWLRGTSMTCYGRTSDSGGVQANFALGFDLIASDPARRGIRLTTLARPVVLDGCPRSPFDSRMEPCAA